MASTPIPGHPVRGSTSGRPIMALLDLVGRRWALRIVWELHEGDATFRDLAHRCDDVSSSVLRDRLRDLTVAGIVERGDGGYRLTGHKAFGSLTPVWTYLGMHAMDMSDPSAPKIVHVFMPRDTPMANQVEAAQYGARLSLVDGLINDCGRIIAERKAAEGWFDLSTLKEPYRLEGKKTMGYEITEQLGWHVPDVIIYPTGGGTGLIGMWKAFGELEELGWIGSARPRMVSVQASGCAPIVKAFEEGKTAAEPWQNAKTVASGLRVPQAVADFLILQAIRESGGTAVSVSDEAMLEEIPRVGKSEGIFFCPEGAACVAALRRLRLNDWIRAADEVVIFNTASGLKYLDVIQKTPH